MGALLFIKTGGCRQLGRASLGGCGCGRPSVDSFMHRIIVTWKGFDLNLQRCSITLSYGLICANRGSLSR
jgi:hypothetical protein